MLDLTTLATIQTFIEQNLMMVAIGHIGIVVVLLVFYFNMGKNEPFQEPVEKDEDTFDYGTESGAMFRSNVDDSIRPNDAEEPQESETEAEESGIDEPIVFNSQINEDKIPQVEEVETKEEEDTVEEPAEETPEVNANPEADLEARKETKIQEVLNRESDHAIVIINRDEHILDLNENAHNQYQYVKEDIEGKKIDEIIFLDEQDDETESESRQSAQILSKTGEKTPVFVELEMEDREFGIISVTIYPESTTGLKLAGLDQPSEEEAISLSEPEPEAEEEKTIKLPEKEEVEEIQEEPQPEPAPPAVAKPSIPLPPPPKKGLVKPLAPARLGGKQLDNKTVEMFSNQLSQPLQSIVQLAELISNDENAIPHLKKYAVAIQAKSNRMMSQIEEMSMLVSAQKGQLQVQDNPFNMSKMILSLVDVASSVTKENGQNIHYTPEDQDLIVISDKDHFEKVTSNLINIILHAAEEQDINIKLSSELITENQDPSKKITFDGQDMQIGSTRKISIKGEFPSDPNTNKFFDISINRTEDNTIVHKLQSSGSLNNYNSSIRLMKELARGVGGKLVFIPDNTEKGVIELSVELQCAQVGAYPA